MVVGGIIALLPGMSLMVAAQEAISLFAVTAAARVVELTMATVGIVAGCFSAWSLPMSTASTCRSQLAAAEQLSPSRSRFSPPPWRPSRLR